MYFLSSYNEGILDPSPKECLLFYKPQVHDFEIIVCGQRKNAGGGDTNNQTTHILQWNLQLSN